MKTKLTYVGTAAVAAAVLLAACGGATPAPQVVEKTVVVTSAPVEKTVVSTVVSVVTATPDPNAQAKPTDPPGSVQLNASGATFPQPLYEDWAFAFNQLDPSVVINYGGGGSGQGIKDIKAGNVDFAGSDAPLSAKDYQDDPNLQMLPTVAGAVVMAYNVKGITTAITLNSDVIANIYLGKIEKWNDPAIAALNPGVTFPDTPINVVHRSDGSGTTFIFSSFLSAVSADWKSGPGAGTAVEWPVDKLKRGQGGKGNPGVAAAIQNTEGAIGYVELAYARNNNILFAKQVNAAGKTVEASIPSTVAAIKSAKFNEHLNALIVNAPDTEAWPIAGFTYLIVNKDYQDCKKAEKVLSFYNWALTDKGAAARAAKLLYAPLPGDVMPTIQSAVKSITCQGKPVM
ncbi:MAG: phosphate ABC transporter substrate-binding protein PstS [Chloroflexi bacterium]|nr:phosphate ABC transporter substrate-binding protein PstS [Chloroflexota bacterium]